MPTYCKDSIANLMTELVSRREVAKIADRIAKNIFVGQRVDITRQNVALRETIKEMQEEIKKLKKSVEELENNHDRLAGDVDQCAEKINSSV